MDFELSSLTQLLIFFLKVESAAVNLALMLADLSACGMQSEKFGRP